ncbi:hypothetical protein [Desulfobacter postgatei]
MIKKTPTFGTRLDTDYILGMAKIEGGVKILLNIDKALSGEEISKIKNAKKLYFLAHVALQGLFMG